MSELSRLRSALCELEVDARRIVAAPDGEGWLPASLRVMCARDEACAHELAEFVAAESALLGLREPRRADPFFTARVIEALPAAWIGSRLSPHRRAMILGVFYAAAALSCWVVLTVLDPELPVAVADRAHGWLTHSGGLEWPALGAVAAAALAAFALMARRSHTPVA
jgi:hypothetical protein